MSRFSKVFVPLLLFVGLLLAAYAAVPFTAAIIPPEIQLPEVQLVEPETTRQKWEPYYGLHEFGNTKEVFELYPEIREAIRPERIYWYSLYVPTSFSFRITMSKEEFDKLFAKKPKPRWQFW